MQFERQLTDAAEGTCLEDGTDDFDFVALAGAFAVYFDNVDDAVLVVEFKEELFEGTDVPVSWGGGWNSVDEQ